MVRDFFQNNGFPINIFNKQLKNFLDKLYNTCIPIQTAQKQIVYATIPFLGYCTNNMKNEILKIFSKHYPQVDLRLVFTNKFSIGNLFKHKEKLPDLLCSGIEFMRLSDL